MLESDNTVAPAVTSLVSLAAPTSSLDLSTAPLTSRPSAYPTTDDINTSASASMASSKSYHSFPPKSMTICLMTRFYRLCYKQGDECRYRYREPLCQRFGAQYDWDVWGCGCAHDSHGWDTRCCCRCCRLRCSGPVDATSISYILSCFQRSMCIRESGCICVIENMDSFEKDIVYIFGKRWGFCD